MSKSLIRLLLTWVVVSVLIGAYAWYNIVVSAIPAWLDVGLAILLLLGITRTHTVAMITRWLERHQFARWLAWFVLAIIILTGGIYALAIEDTSLPGLLGVLRDKMWSLYGPFWALKDSYTTSGPMSANSMLLGTVVALGWGVVALGAATLVQTVLDDLHPEFVKWPATLTPHLPIRTSRWIAWMWRGVGAAALVLILGIGIPIILGAANSGTLSWQRIATAPTSLASISSILVADSGIYAGTNIGVFRSTDHGENWQPSVSGLGQIAVSQLAVDKHSGALYAAVPYGVYRSNDSGASWQPASVVLTDTYVSALVVDERSGSVYVGTRNAILRSMDEGETWESSNVKLNDEYIKALVLDQRDRILYAVLSSPASYRGDNGSYKRPSHILRSTDNGFTWQPVGAEWPTMNIEVLAVDQQDGTLYIGTSDGVMRSIDKGKNWQTTDVGTTQAAFTAIVIDKRSGTLYTGAELSSITYPKNCSTICQPAVDGGVFISKDEGGSWQTTNAGLTNVDIRSLAIDERDGALYAGTSNGIFRLANEGSSWSLASNGLLRAPIVKTLALDERSGLLYAGVSGGGVFRLADDSTNWQAVSVGLEGTDVRALWLNERDSTMYAGIYNSRYPIYNLENKRAYLSGADHVVFRSIDAGNSWNAAGTAEEFSDSSITTLLGGPGDTFYAGTDQGVFRTIDGGRSWQSASTALTDTVVSALILSEDTRILYAATHTIYLQKSPDEQNGTLTERSNLFRSIDGGDNWQIISILPPSGVLALELDNRDDSLYAGTTKGALRSTDGGANWQETGTELGDVAVRSLLLDERTGVLYAGTSKGVFRSIDKGANWQNAGADLGDVDVQTLILDGRNGTLYAGTSQGVFRSKDSGSSWQAINTGLTDIQVRSLLPQENDLFIQTPESELFRSVGEIEGWKSVTPETKPVIDNNPIWDSHEMGWNNRVIWLTGESAPAFAIVEDTYLRLWSPLTVTITENSAPALVSKNDFQDFPALQKANGDIEAYRAWGATISRAELHSNFPFSTLGIHALVYLWLQDNGGWLLVVGVVALLLIVATTYSNISRPYGIPLWAFILAPRRLTAYVRQDRFDAAWPNWSHDIRQELIHYGDASPADLRRIPSPLRKYALQRYDTTYAAEQLIELQRGQLRLLAGARTRRWQVAWNTTSYSLGKQAGLDVAIHPAIDELATTLAEAMGFILGPARDFEAVRAYQVEAPALRLKVPPRFPLVFIADPAPDTQTVQMLVDAVDVIKESGYFAIVVPLEPARRELDVSAELRQAIDRSAHVQDFIVLSHNDVLSILISRHPAQVLAQRILAQIDLSIVAPFIVGGPVPETMFFGREAEIKKIVERAASADFAVIGNRKIGKTSLLHRSRARLLDGRRVRPLLVDCQTVKDVAGFYATFQTQTGVPISSPTLDDFVAALTQLAGEGVLPVIFIDEVDAVLDDDITHGRHLSATWRALSNAGVGHFVFCGSTRLARQLLDAHSPFFNFVESIPLGYLPAETACAVLTQPLDILGLEIEDREVLLQEMLNLTSGHPNFVQYIGRGLVEAVNQRKERRILLSDLAALRASSEFAGYFLSTVWGEAGPLERLITLVAPPSRFRVQEVEAALQAQGITPTDEELDAALEMLVIYSILEKRDRTYAFVPRAFHEILHRTQEVDRLVMQAKRNFEKSDNR